jgi:hypothetical protein
MRPGSRVWCETQSVGGVEVVRWGAATLTSVGKVAGAIAQGTVQTLIQSCWLSSGQSPGVAQLLATLAIGPQGDIANAAG